MSNSTSIIRFYFFTFVILLLIFIHHGSISAYTIHHGKGFDSSKYLTDRSFNADETDEMIEPSSIYPRIYHSNYLAAIPSFDLRNGVVHLIPYKKRTIPLELQKALYAHGIVGR